MGLKFIKICGSLVLRVKNKRRDKKSQRQRSLRENQDDGHPLREKHHPVDKPRHSEGPPPAPADGNIVIRTEADQNPLWLQRRRANKAASRIYQLPEEIVLAILRQTDEATTRVARCSCSLFLRLVASNDARLMPDTAARRHADGRYYWWHHSRFYRVWAARYPYTINRGIPHFPDKRPEWCRPFCAALGRDRALHYCASCLKVQRSGDLARALMRSGLEVWCSACCWWHPRVMFAPDQRHRWKFNTVCRAHQQSVRVCEHAEIPCFPYRKPPFAKWYRELQERIRCEEVVPDRPWMLRWRCGHWSHGDISSSSKNSSSGSTPPPWRTRAVLLGRHYAQRLRSAKGKPACDGCPSVVAKKYDVTTLKWSGHIFDLDPAAPVTRGGLRAHLAAVDPQRVRRMGLCPHVANLADGQLALPFEQGRCACFDGDGDGAPIADGHADPRYHDHGEGQSCCRCIIRGGGARRPGVFMPSGPCAPGGQDRARSHIYVCYFCESAYVWVRKGRQMHLESTRTVRATSDFLASRQWMRHIDPMSWGLHCDEELRAAVWCDDPQCKTVSRYSALMRALQPP